MRNNLNIHFSFPGKEQERVMSSSLTASDLLPFLLLEPNVHKSMNVKSMNLRATYITRRRTRCQWVLMFWHPVNSQRN